MTSAALGYIADRFPLFPNALGGVVMFASPAAIGIAAAVEVPELHVVLLALLLFVLGLFAMRVADDLIDSQADAAAKPALGSDSARPRVMALLGATTALLILTGSTLVSGGWLMMLFLLWLAAVSLTLNRSPWAGTALLWLANEPMYLILLLFAYAAGAGSLPPGASGLFVIQGSWLMIESWEVGRKCFAAAKSPAAPDIYTRRLGEGGARLLFLAFYCGGAALLAAAGAAAGLGAAGPFLLLCAAAAFLFRFRNKPVTAALAFFMAGSLFLAGGALFVRFGG